MTDIWKEREKALENEYIYKKEQLQITKMKEAADKEKMAVCRNHCPKCGEKLVEMNFRGVPLDQCPGCKGIWLGPNDLAILAEKDHRTWFDKWFKGEA
ncbi:MAG: zf-TFIIB domain-containing protein [Desulfuromonadales bacterium]|nr:zf-TFIIB domain-containing protein [Desulfuromonadales bacterium]